MSKKLSFRTELERLEDIVRSLEGDELDLDQALKLFEEGVSKLKSARKLLKESQLKVRKVTEARDGTVDTTDIEI